MKKLERCPPPDCLNNVIPKFQRKNIRFYKTLRDKHGNIRPRWNTTCKNKEGISKIRTQLLMMSDYSCAYCGKPINNGEMDVDHYLPSSQFPYVAYRWENLLPTCEYCNQNTKGNFTPKSLQRKKIVEEIVADEYTHDYVYDKRELLTKIAKDDRLIDPTFDDPEEHLAFDPEFFLYGEKTPIGELTIKTFFDHKEVAERWENISVFIKDLVLEEVSEETMSHYIGVHGYEYLCLKFYEYWLREKQEGRIGRG